MFQTYRVSALSTDGLPNFQLIYSNYFSSVLNQHLNYADDLESSLRYAYSQLRQQLAADFTDLNTLAINSPAWAENSIYEELILQKYSFKLNNKELLRILKKENPYINMPFGEVW